MNSEETDFGLLRPSTTIPELLVEGEEGKIKIITNISMNLPTGADVLINLYYAPDGADADDAVNNLCGPYPINKDKSNNGKCWWPLKDGGKIYVSVDRADSIIFVATGLERSVKI